MDDPSSLHPLRTLSSRPHISNMVRYLSVRVRTTESSLFTEISSLLLDVCRTMDQLESLFVEFFQSNSPFTFKDLSLVCSFRLRTLKVYQIFGGDSTLWQFMEAQKSIRTLCILLPSRQLEQLLQSMPEHRNLVSDLTLLESLPEVVAVLAQGELSPLLRLHLLCRERLTPMPAMPTITSLRLRIAEPIPSLPHYLPFFTNLVSLWVTASHWQVLASYHPTPKC